MSENYILRVYTNDWAGNVDTNVQAALFGIDDDRHGSENGLILLNRYLTEFPQGEFAIGSVVEGHPDNDSYYSENEMYYSVAQVHGQDGPGSSYVEFYLNKKQTDECFDALVKRLRWLRDNDPTNLVGIVDFKLISRVVVETTVEIPL